MKALLLSVALLCLAATQVLAIGCDLTVYACPGSAGANNDAGALDCAAGTVLQLLATMQPAEAITDFVGADGIVDVVTTGDVLASADFWDFAGANSAAMTSSHHRPQVICSNYSNVFGSVAGSGSGFVVDWISPTSERVRMQSYRPSIRSVALDEKLFYISLAIDASTSLEASGLRSGCTLTTYFTLAQVVPGSLSGSPTTPLTSGSQMLNQVVVNGGGVPTLPKSWGALKSLYR